MCGPCPRVVDQEGPRNLKTKQSAIGIIFHSSPDPDRKILLLKIPYILVTGHREILVLSRKLCALWLVFTILEGTMQPVEGEQTGDLVKDQSSWEEHLPFSSAKILASKPCPLWLKTPRLKAQLWPAISSLFSSPFKMALKNLVMDLSLYPRVQSHYCSMPYHCGSEILSYWQLQFILA